MLRDNCKNKNLKVNDGFISLSEIEILLLDSLYRHDFLTGPQIKAIFYPHISYPGFWKHLRKLVRMELIYKEIYSNGRTRKWVIWRLTGQGLKKVSFLTNAESFERNNPQLQRVRLTQLEHDVMVNQTYVDFLQSASDLQEAREGIVWYPFSERYLKYNEGKKYDHIRKRCCHSCNFIYPDAIFECLPIESKVYFELDMNTKSVYDIQNNLKAYADYFKESKEEAGRLVILLFSVPNQRRRETIEKIANDLGGEKAFANFRCRVYGPELLSLLNKMLDKKSSEQSQRD